MDKKKCAIIISDDHYNALGLIRSIGKKHFYIILILTCPNKSYIAKSRYVKELIIAGKDDKKIVNYLNQISGRFSICFVFPTSDYSAEILDHSLLSLNTNLIVPNMRGRLHDYQDKIVSKKHAVEAELLTPPGIQINLEELNMVEWRIYPSIIKPVASINGLKSDIVIVENFDELINKLDAFRSRGYKTVLVEQYIDGKESYMVEVMGYSSEKNVVFTGIVKKIREYPIKNGSTSYALLVDSQKGLDTDKVVNYIKQSGYIGLFDIEFKYLDGKLYFIECNFRNGAPNYAITKIRRVNTPVEWMIDMSENRLVDQSLVIAKNKFFMVEQTDILNLLKHEVAFRVWISEYLKSTKVFWEWSDCYPNICYFLRMIKLAINKLRRK